MLRSVALGLVLCSSIFSESVTWMSTSAGGNYDLNDPVNWQPEVIPSGADAAVFDSSIPDIIFTPFAKNSDFTVSSLEFVQEAFPFHITVHEHSLVLEGAGILGLKTDAHIEVRNEDNSDPGLLVQLYLTGGGPVSLGSANIVAFNTAALMGQAGETLLSNAVGQIGSTSLLSLGKGAIVSVDNRGLDFSNGPGNNLVASLFYQVALRGGLVAEDEVRLSVYNQGVNKSTTTSWADFVACVTDPQFTCQGDCVLGSDCHLEVTNKGEQWGGGIGPTSIARFEAPQVRLTENFIAQDRLNFTVENIGNAYTSTSEGEYLCYIIDAQLFVVGDMTIGDALSLTVRNRGSDSSEGVGGGSINCIDSFSGTTGYQMVVNGVCSLGKAANILVSNEMFASGTKTASGVGVGIMNQGQVRWVGAFSAGDELALTVSNYGEDSSRGFGGNSIGSVSTNQVEWDSSCTLGDKASLRIANKGVLSGENASLFGYAGAIGGGQLLCTGVFTAQNEFSLEVTNEGVFSGSGWGASLVGTCVGGRQVALLSSCFLGDEATLLLSNKATQQGTAQYGGYIGSFFGMGQQLYVEENFQAGNTLKLTATNTAYDASVHSSSGVVGSFLSLYSLASQVHMGGSCAVGDSATIVLSNQGSREGEGVYPGQLVAVLGGAQLLVGSTCSAGDSFTLDVLNEGTYEAQGLGGVFVGLAGGSEGQVWLSQNVSWGEDAHVTITNVGTQSGTCTDSSNMVGVIPNRQLYVGGNLSTGSNAIFSVSNEGSLTGQAVSGCEIGYIMVGSQVHLGGTCSLGNGAFFLIDNKGSCFSDATTTACYVGAVGVSQFTALGSFAAEGDLTFNVFNQGEVRGGGGHLSGYVTNTQASFQDDVTVSGAFTSQIGNTGTLHDVTAGGHYVAVLLQGGQLEFQRACLIGDYSSFEIANKGTCGGQASDGSQVGVIGKGQFLVEGDFSAGRGLAISVSNLGEQVMSGRGVAGIIGDSQVKFQGRVTLQEDAIFVITNRGSTTDSLAPGDTIGYVNGSQFSVDGPFSAGSGVSLTVQNEAFGRQNGQVGFVAGSQVEFNDVCVLGSGSFIMVENTGVVGGSQMVFHQGVVAQGGPITLQVSNKGTIGENSLRIEGSGQGGQILVVLEEADLQILANSVSTYTLGGLSGDQTSYVNCAPPTLILDTAVGVDCSFTGVIEDYPAQVNSLIKRGRGRQVLAGNNTYTGSSRIEGGILSVQGSLVGDVIVSSGGTLAGTGLVGGSVQVNQGGQLSPGNSIGTVTLGSLNQDQGATTRIEINAKDSSKVIVQKEARIAGALHVVTDPDSYGRRGSYEILSSQTLEGTFSSISKSHEGFTYSVSYTPHSVSLNYELSIPTKGLTGNSLTIADYLNRHSSASLGFSSLAMLSGGALTEALERVSPSRNTFCTYASQQTAFAVSSLLTNHVDGMRLTKDSHEDASLALVAEASDTVRSPQKKAGLSVWTAGLGEYARQRKITQNPSFDFISEAALVGVDLRCERGNCLGAALGYAHTRLNEKGQAGHGNIQYGLTSLYGFLSWGHLYLSPALWGIFDKANHVREIAYPGFSGKAKATIFAWQAVPHLELGYELPFTSFTLTPYSSADWALTWQRGFQEKGASPFNVKQKRNNCSMVRSETGFKISERWNCGWGTLFLKEKIAYVFEKPYGTGVVTTAFVGMPSSFTVAAWQGNLNLGLVGLSLLAVFGKDKTLDVDVSYEGEWGSSYQSQNLMVTVNKKI